MSCVFSVQLFRKTDTIFGEKSTVRHTTANVIYHVTQHPNHATPSNDAFQDNVIVLRLFLFVTKKKNRIQTKTRVFYGRSSKPKFRTDT